MKKYIFGLFMAAATLCVMNSCKEDEGQMPGNDKNPHVAIFQYDVDNDYDADCDVAIALYPNNKATEVYYLAEPVEAKAQKVASMGEAGYADYVAKNGTKVSCTADNPARITLTKIFGAQAISAVGVNGSNVQAKAVEVQFTGLEWKTLATGTYRCSKTNFGAPAEMSGVELQALSTNSDKMRFKNLYGTNKHLYFDLLRDASGKERMEGVNFGGALISVAPQVTCYSYGSYGTVSVRDYAHYKGDDDYQAYAEMTPAYRVAMYVQYFVSAGSLGVGWDQFTPN